MISISLEANREEVEAANAEKSILFGSPLPVWIA
jgi:hypothetical protein